MLKFIEKYFKFFLVFWLVLIATTCIKSAFFTKDEVACDIGDIYVYATG